MSSILLTEDHGLFAQVIQRLLRRQIDLEIVDIVRSDDDALKNGLR
jgi:hypothetical protein